MKQIATALVKAQKEFSPALKTHTNPHFKSKYADLAACLEAVQDPLNSNGIALLQVTHADESGVTVETLFIHESGEQISGGKLHIPANKQDAQGYGSALSYARRYSLLAACGIAAIDDDGIAASKPEKAPKIDDKRLIKAIESIKSGTYTTDKLRAAFSLTEEQDAKVVAELSKENA